MGHKQTIVAKGGISKRSERRAIKWVDWMEAVAFAQWAAGNGPSAGLDELALPYFEWRHQEGWLEKECGLCMKPARTRILGTALCPKCYLSTPSPDEGYLLEGLMLMTELAGQAWGMNEARKAVLSIGAAKRWRRWFVENRYSRYAARFKWYTAIREVAGVALLMSDVDRGGLGLATG